MIRSLLLAMLALSYISGALADEHRLCVALSGPKGAIVERGGSWVEVTPEQRLFLAGVYALNPGTPPGLPFGDKAVIAKIKEDPGALIFFIDGDKACTPMPVPPELVEMLTAIGSGEISHEGQTN